MKTFIKLLAVLTVIAMASGGAYYFSEHEYAKKIEIEKIDKTLGSLQEEIEKLKNTLLEQQSKNTSKLSEIDQKIGLLQKNIKTLENDFSEWQGTKKSEQEQTNQTLTSLQAKNNQLLLSLQADLKGLKETYLSKSESVSYNPLDIDLGPLPSGKPNSLTYKIPASIPETAREILIYAYIATSFVKGGAHSFKISVKPNETGEAAFYLYAFADAKPGWSYNSENMWLPMPADRAVIIQTNGEPLFGSWNSGVKIVAYR
jgi:uncharacterized small protein (DUF1192 family)